MISSLNNPRVKLARRLQADRRARQREGLFVVEGTRWLAELVHGGHEAAFVLYTSAWAQTGPAGRLLAQLDAPAYAVTEAVLASVSDTESPPGALAVLPRPVLSWPAPPDLVLILDQLRDPGNLGTILRSAAAAGCDGVVIAPGTVDPYNPKAVRASMGALLRLPVAQLNWAEIAPRVSPLAVFLAAADGARIYTTVDWSAPSALIIGGEAAGPSSAAHSLARARIRIPMRSTTESLNAAVAASVILFEAARQRTAAGLAVGDL